MTMTVLTRILHDRDNPAMEIPIVIFSPVEKHNSWWCRFAIGWPDGELARTAGGVDAIHALEMAMQMIGSELYVSDLHRQARLTWLEPGDGYGFPVPRTIRDLLEGADRDRFGW